MSAAKKIYDSEKPAPDSQEVPEWKKKKQSRQHLLRAIRGKYFTETIRGAIRQEIKKNPPDLDDES